MDSWLTIVLLLANLLLLGWLVLRQLAAPKADSASAELLAALAAGHNRVERELRREIGDSARSQRQELAASLATFQQTLVQQSAEAQRSQSRQMEAFAQQIGLLQASLSDTLATQLQSVSEANARRMLEVRATLEKQLTRSAASPGLQAGVKSA